MLEKQRTHYSQQSLMPSLSFTCNGTLTALAFAAQVGLGTLLPELQVWRPAASNGSGPYTKVFSTNQLQPRETIYPNVYVVQNLTHKFHSGDVIGLHQPSRENSSLVLLYRDSGAATVSYRVARLATALSIFSLTQPGVLTDLGTLPLMGVQTSEIMTRTCIFNTSCICMLHGMACMGTSRISVRMYMRAYV